MKREQADFPYEDFWLYKVWHEKEGRWQANLVRKSDTSIRTTITYAKYVLSVFLGRLLDPETEHVDHVDNNKTNDLVENLQILTPEENREKQRLLYRELHPEFIKLKCPICGKEFNYLMRNFKFHTNRGRGRFHCSRECSHESLRKNLSSNV